MRVPRFYTEQPLAVDETVELEATASHHLLRVLRSRPGETLLLFNGDGKEYQAIFMDAHDGRARLRIESRNLPDRESNLRIHLGQGISRGERMDFVLQKSVELGVASITPLWTRRSQVHLSGRRLQKRLCHWQGVIHSACEQTGRVYLPKLHDAVKLDGWLGDKTDGSLKLVLDPTASLHLRDLDPATNIRILIGPEGGLDDEEIGTSAAAGFRRIQLGPRTLRTETAALASLAALQALWGDLCA
jgi:16S rRNA (uracil1498-N3)-methyltransferase